MKRVAALLIALVLIVGMVGCPAAPVQVELHVSATSGGSVTSPGEGTYTYGAGTVVDLVAEAEQGYRFVEWTGDVGTLASVNAASTTVTINGDYSITANFVAVYDLSISSTTGGSVTAPGDGTFTYDEGAIVGLVARAEVGYQFLNWVGDVDTVAATGDAYTTVRMDGPYAITAMFGAEEVVFFADANLEAAVREAIDVPERLIYPSDLKGLTFLDAGDRGIYDLTGIEHCTGLTDLVLGDNWIRDISPLVGLSNLVGLSLWHNEIGDMSPLAGLTGLSGLDLGGNWICDISPLESLTALTHLHVWGNQISDISPLEGLTKLECLNLEGNRISDISPLAGLTALSGLHLWHNEIGDMSPLANLIHLRELSVTIERLSDMRVLPDLPNLAELDLHIRHINDAELPGLAELAHLRSLNLDGNQLSDISPLAGLTGLTGLELGGNQISDISPLAGLSELTHLYLWHNQISDVSPLADLTTLRALQLDGNRISDVTPLATLSALTLLWLDGNRVDDITPLADLENLEWLCLRDNQISDIKPLVDNPGLGHADTVYLSHNPLSEQSINEYIPALEARGVTVHYEEGLGLDGLQQWFVLHGYDIDVVNDDLGIDTFPPGQVQVTVLDTEGWHAYDNPTGWYTSKEQAFLLFPGRPAAGDTATFITSDSFGLFIDSDEGRFYTETNLNPDGFEHALVYQNTRGSGYIVAFEDLWGGGDMDYTDRILEVIISSATTTSGE